MFPANDDSHRPVRMTRPEPIGWETPADDPPHYNLPPLPIYAPMSREEAAERNEAYSASRRGRNPPFKRGG